MADKPCIVAIGAHTADMEFTAGATLLKHVRQGWEAHLISLTLGEKGSARLSPAEYGAQKKAEAEEAARLLQATPHFFPYLDGELPNTDEVARPLALLLRRLQPQVIITHWRDSIHVPGVDVHHYTEGLAFLEKRGFEITSRPLSMDANIVLKETRRFAVLRRPL